MADIHKKPVETRSGSYIVRRKKRRRTSNVRDNLLWCGIILILALILGAIIAFYSNYFDDYFRSDKEEMTLSDQQMAKKLRDVYRDKMNHEATR